MLKIKEKIEDVKADDLRELLGVETDRLVLHWRDRLLKFHSSKAEELGLDLGVEIKDFRVYDCPSCGKYLTVDASVGGDHPHRAMKSAMSSASRALAKLEKLDQRVHERTGRRIVFQHIILTFPPELRGIDEETAWACFKVFWEGLKSEYTIGEAAKVLGLTKEELKEKIDRGEVEVEERSGKRGRTIKRITREEVLRLKGLLGHDDKYLRKSFKERGWGAWVNLHTWSSKNPEGLLRGERHLHFHVILAMVKVNDDGSFELPSTGWIDMDALRVAWAWAIERVTGYGFNWEEDLRHRLDVRPNSYFTLEGEGRAKLLHNLKYATRKWNVDLAMKAVEEHDGDGDYFLEELTATENFEDLWRASNKARAFGWWRRLRRLLGEDIEVEKRCPVCGGVVRYLGKVRVEDVRINEIIFVEKRGRVRKLPHTPGWLLDLVLKEVEDGYSEVAFS